MGAINKRMGREIRMDASKQPGQTAGMEANTKTVAQLLALARDITRETLGATPDAVVAEVFRQLCVEREYHLCQPSDQTSPLH